MVEDSVVNLDPYKSNGACFGSTQLMPEDGEPIGVVLLSHGEPEGHDSVLSYLYDIYKDPLITSAPFGGVARSIWAKWTARSRHRELREGLLHTGGAAAFSQLKEDQRKALQDTLDGRYRPYATLRFVTYVSNSYGKRLHSEVIQSMKERGIRKVILVPMYPQFGRGTTGATVLRFQSAARKLGASFECSLVPEYATHPKLLMALNERIDEALQRFPKSVRHNVALIFNAHSLAVQDFRSKKDPFLHLVHESVRKLIESRNDSRVYEIAFGGRTHFNSRYVKPWTTDVIAQLTKEGKTALLVVPVSYIHDHFETDYTLDNVCGSFAEKKGVKHYEVTTGLNCHELLIDVLADAVASRITPRQVAGLNKVDSRWRTVDTDNGPIWVQRWQNDDLAPWVAARKAS